MRHFFIECVIAIILFWFYTTYANATPCPVPDDIGPNRPVHLGTQYNATEDAVISFWSWGGDNGPTPQCPNGVGFCQSNSLSSETNQQCYNKNKVFRYRVKGTTTWTYTDKVWFKVPCSAHPGVNVSVEAEAYDAAVDPSDPLKSNKSPDPPTNSPHDLDDPNDPNDAHTQCPGTIPGDCKVTGCTKQGIVWSCSGVVDTCGNGNVCPPTASITMDFKQYAEGLLSLTIDGGIPNNCTENPAGSGRYQCSFNVCGPPYTGGGTVTQGKCEKDASGTWKKINCSGRCPGPSGGQPVQGPCVACGEPNVDFGVCAVQPTGEIFDSCCTGSVPQLNRDGVCECILTKNAVNTLFTNINGLMIPITIILGIFLIVLKGYKIMTSQGDPQKLEEGKEGLTSAIIGLIFVLLAVSILRVIIKALISGDADPFVM